MVCLTVMPQQTHQLRICTPTVSLMVVRRVDFAGFAWFRRLKAAIGREIKPLAVASLHTAGLFSILSPQRHLI
jgi:hypothetical protein